MLMVFRNHLQPDKSFVDFMICTYKSTVVVLFHFPKIILQIFSLSLAKKAQELKMEKKKADKLLFQMLPPTVATSLQQKKQVNRQSCKVDQTGIGKSCKKTCVIKLTKNLT